MIESLVEAVRTKQVILFVGSGVSRGLGLPSWDDLVAEMGRQLGFDPEVFRLHGDNVELAEYYELKKTNLGALRSWMDREWHKDPERVKKSDVHEAIMALRCPTIYTTNYDRWLEFAFEHSNRKCVKIANVGDFTTVRDSTEDVTQIVKLHGDFDFDGSLVLSESSYFSRLSFESPLDIKLRADTIGKTILFIGYSLRDVNIRYFLYKLQCLWAASTYAAARPRSFIFLAKPNPVQEVILESRGIVPVVSTDDDPAMGLVTFLNTLVLKAFGTNSANRETI